MQICILTTAVFPLLLKKGIHYNVALSYNPKNRFGCNKKTFPQNVLFFPTKVSPTVYAFTPKLLREKTLTEKLDLTFRAYKKQIYY